nr:LysM peptidoglycan-binding domain-containing protein [Merdimmobilis hominis]
MFQYTSKGTVSGIAGNVDLNECYKDFPSIIKEAGKNGFSVVETITPPSKPSEKTYTVKTGDSFWKIAQEQLGDGTRYQELAAYNGMRTDDVIYPGQVLKLPAGTQTAVPNKAYTVEKGDSFWKIAQEQLGDGTRYQELAAYNGMRADDVIYPGQVLKLP